MDLSGYTIGIGITGSFCTFDKVKIEIREMKQVFGDIVPIFSNSAASYSLSGGVPKPSFIFFLSFSNSRFLNCIELYRKIANTTTIIAI